MAIHLENALDDVVSTSPIITFLPIFTESEALVVYEKAPDSQYAISVGCIDAVHYGLNGPISYLNLFAALAADKYDPLRPIRGNKAKNYVGRKIAGIIYSNAKANRQNRIYRAIVKYARELRDFVCDYIEGSIAIPSFGSESNHKWPLDQNTIYKRRSLMKSRPYLYGGDGGINEPLYETGTLWESIKWLVERVDIVSKKVKERSRAASLREAKKRERRIARGDFGTKQYRKSEQKPKEPTKEAMKVRARSPRANASAVSISEYIRRYVNAVYAVETGFDRETGNAIQRGLRDSLRTVRDRNLQDAYNAGATDRQVLDALNDLGIGEFTI